MTPRKKIVCVYAARCSKTDSVPHTLFNLRLTPTPTSTSLTALSSTHAASSRCAPFSIQPIRSRRLYMALPSDGTALSAFDLLHSPCISTTSLTSVGDLKKHSQRLNQQARRHPKNCRKRRKTKSQRKEGARKEV